MTSASDSGLENQRFCQSRKKSFQDSIEVFTDIFIKSDFQLAFDAFTVLDNLEEIKNLKADACIFRLKNTIEDIQDDKKPLYFELIKILEDKKENPAKAGFFIIVHLRNIS